MHKTTQNSLVKSHQKLGESTGFNKVLSFQKKYDRVHKLVQFLFGATKFEVPMVGNSKPICVLWAGVTVFCSLRFSALSYRYKASWCFSSQRETALTSPASFMSRNCIWSENSSLAILLLLAEEAEPRVAKER